MPAAEVPAAEVFAGRTSTLRPEPAAEGDATDAALGCPSDQGAADSADQVPVPADGTADAGDAIVTPSDDGPWSAVGCCSGSGGTPISLASTVWSMPGSVGSSENCLTVWLPEESAIAIRTVMAATLSPAHQISSPTRCAGDSRARMACAATDFQPLSAGPRYSTFSDSSFKESSAAA